MSSLPLVFFSYAREDDKHHDGQITRICHKLMNEVNNQTAEDYSYFLDNESISWGQKYNELINESLGEVNFFIPFMSPRYFRSDFCRKELTAFLEHQQQLNRNDLILPIYYVDCQYFSFSEQQKQQWQEIIAHQFIDWREHRFEDLETVVFRKLFVAMANDFIAAIKRSSEKKPVKPNPRVEVIEKQQAPNPLEAMPKPDWALNRGQDAKGLWFELSQQGKTGRVYVPAWCRVYGFDQYGFYADLLREGIYQRFRWILPGRFFMGSPDTEPERYDDDEVSHEVLLTQGFWLADTTCTQALWQVVMGNNPARFKDNANNPVEQVSWNDTQQFLQRLNAQIPALKAGLPTEAQWEYACRAGTVTPFSFGTTITPEQVNYDGNHPYNQGKKGLYRQTTVPVKSLPANPWGLYEMHGNVWEWCLDYYGKLSRDSVTDPKRLKTGSYRVLRGGSWDFHGRDTRSAYRDRFDPAYSNYYNGFRLALG